MNNIESYHVEMQGEGEPILFLHGFTGSGDTWRGIASSIPCCAVMPDLSGHRRSVAVASDLEMEAEAMKNIMNGAGFESFHVVGYSMGGRLALALAILHPDSVRSLVLESASPGLESKDERDARRQSDEKLAETIEQEGIESFISFWENLPMFESQKSMPFSIRNSVRRERLNQTASGLASSLLRMGTGAQKSYWDRLHELTMPVLLLTGTLDEKFTNIARHMKKSISNCEWIEFDHAGHAIHVEQREKFGTIVKTFLFKTKGGNLNGF